MNEVDLILEGHLLRDSRDRCETQTSMACNVLYLQGNDFKLDDDSYDEKRQVEFGFDRPNDQ
jgi:hypothetical protein